MSPVQVQLLLIATMAVWGLNISAIKVLTAQLDPLLVSCFRMVLASVVIHLTLMHAGRKLKLSKISPAQWLRFVLCSLFMVYGNVNGDPTAELQIEVFSGSLLITDFIL